MKKPEEDRVGIYYIPTPENGQIIGVIQTELILV